MNQKSDKGISQANAYVVVVAAGVGKRMAMAVNKPFLVLAGIPVIVRTLMAFESVDPVAGIILVAAPPECDAMRQLLKEHSVSKLLTIAPGGATRQQSVYQGLVALSSSVNLHPDTPVLVHDGARCLIQAAVINRVIDGICQYGACGAAVPSKDTVKLVSSSGRIRQTPQRSGVQLMQTPQGASWQQLWCAYQQADAENWETTDDLSVLEQAGFQTFVVMGDTNNLKLTTQEDLAYASWLLDQSES